eukprot:PhF_6_TR38694/c0_g1_i1/m.57894
MFSKLLGEKSKRPRNGTSTGFGKLIQTRSSSWHTRSKVSVRKDPNMSLRLCSPFTRITKKKKNALTNEEMAELKRMDTERMARESVQYKERKQRIQDDLDKARGELLRKFLNKRMLVEPDLKKLQPGNHFSGKTSKDIVKELRDSAAAAKAALPEGKPSAAPAAGGPPPPPPPAAKPAPSLTPRAGTPTTQPEEPKK